MNESEFHERVDSTLDEVESALEEASTDLDVDLNNGVLTVICENGSRIILTRQTPVRQLWLATREDGYHFDWQDNEWVELKKGGTLSERLSAAFAQQAQESLSFNLRQD